MPTNHNFAREIAFVLNLKSLVSTYEEIAVMRIGSTRTAVLTARQFREGLSRVFDDVRRSYQQEVRAALARQKKRMVARQALVLFSTNSHLAGSVTAEVARTFVSYIKEHPEAEVIIVGQAGKERVVSMLPGQPHTFFAIPEEKVTLEDLQPLLKHLLQYEGATIFYARFQNLISQAPTFQTLGDALTVSAGGPVKGGAGGPAAAERDTYLFEPSLDHVVDFFNTQILSLLLHQTWNESWLSLLGSRITAMEKASLNIDERLHKMAWEKRREERRIANKKQRDRLSGIYLWQN